jgi:RNA polymerase sigma-70 factor (ECF subfamily)
VQASEEELAEGVRNGLKDCFQEVFHRYYENLCRYAFTILRDMDEAEDIVQSVFTKFWEKREAFVITHTLRSYLYRAVHNQCMNLLEHRQIRQKHMTHTLQQVSEAEGPVVFPQELEEVVQKAIMELPPQCRTIFNMSRYEELRYAEIAEKLGISVNTVENQISKALRILRAQLQDIFV